MNLTKSNYTRPQIQKCAVTKHLSLLARLSYDLSFEAMENYDTAEEDYDEIQN